MTSTDTHRATPVAEPGPGGARPDGRFPRSVVPIIARFGLIGLAVLVAVFFANFTQSQTAFPTSGNLQAVLGSVSVVSILAIGSLLPLVSGNLDFTVGAVCGLSAVATAAVMSRHDGPLWLAVMAGVGCGLIAGLVNAVLVAVVKLNSFIVTIGMGTLLTGVVQWYTGGLDLITNISSGLTDFGSGRLLGVPTPFYLVLLITLLCAYLLQSTPYGRRLQAIGANERAAALVGIRVERTVFLAFAASGSFAGVAGCVLVARNGGAVAGAGPDLLFPALAAVFLGATTIDPGKYNVLGTLVGVLFVAIAVSGLTLSGAAAWAPDVFNGGALVVAVALSTVLSRRRRRAG